MKFREQEPFFKCLVLTLTSYGRGRDSVKGQDGRVIGIELAPVSQPVASFVSEMLVVWGGWKQTWGKAGEDSVM